MVEALRHDRVIPRRSLVARARRLVRRRWMFLVTFPLVGLVAAYGLSASHEDRYESSAKLLLHDPAATGAPADTPDGTAAADSSRQTATNVDLVSSDEVALRVYTALMPPISLDRFLDSVRIASRGDSELVTITAREADPALAARIANAWADEYRSFRREADDARLAAATRIVDQRLAALPADRLAGGEGQALRRQRDELAVAASLQRAGVEVAQRAREATSPVSPRPVRAALIGGLAGLAIALVLALLAQRLDRRVADADVAAALHGLPLLGQIPKAAALAAPPPAANGGPPLLPPLAAAETDAFRVLRTSIAYPDVQGEIGSILVTSAVAGEGKTTVALNLARAYAEAGARTLLIEGDLRRPVLSERLALRAEPGLADVLRAEASLATATRRIALDAGHGSRRGGLDVVVAGPATSNPQTLLEGKRMSRLLSDLRGRYEMVVVDGAPGLGVSDSAPLMRTAGAVLVVSRVGRTQTHESQALRDRLALLRVRPLGVVANGVSPRAAHHVPRRVAPVPG